MFNPASGERLKERIGSLSVSAAAGHLGSPRHARPLSCKAGVSARRWLLRLAEVSAPARALVKLR